jgi:hypothetical protein
MHLLSPSLPEQVKHFPLPSLKDLEKDAIKFLIGAAAGWLLKVAGDRWRTRHARAFWRPFISDDMLLVVGRFPQFREFERSCLLGVGDAIALTELQHYLAQIGAKNPQVVYADRLDGDALKHTIITFGGPDANTVTRDAVKLINSKLRFGNPEVNEIAIRDTTSEPPRFYVPPPLDADGTGTDYGLVLRAPNPNKEITIIAGSYGHGTSAATRYLISPTFLALRKSMARESFGSGTWAATRYLISTTFLALRGSKARESFECLVETDVVRDTPQAIRPIVVRSMPRGVATPAI